MDLDLIPLLDVADTIELKPNAMIVLAYDFGKYSLLDIGKEGIYINDPAKGGRVRVNKKDVFIVVQTYNSKL
jgi:hypothetical protein